MSAARRSLLVGTLTVGTLDLVDAFMFYGLRNGIPPPRILQSIASGILGAPAFQGGWPTAVLGGLLHYFIAFGIVGVYWGISRRARFLTGNVWIWGTLFGLAVYAVMNYVVVPLSAAPLKPPAGPAMVNGLLIHVFGVGIPSAWFACRAAAASMST
jgi:hypothetical protein